MWKLGSIVYRPTSISRRVNLVLTPINPIKPVISQYNEHFLFDTREFTTHKFRLKFFPLEFHIIVIEKNIHIIRIKFTSWIPPDKINSYISCKNTVIQTILESFFRIIQILIRVWLLFTSIRSFSRVYHLQTEASVKIRLVRKCRFQQLCLLD